MSGIRYGLILKKKDEPARRIQRSQIFDEDGLEDDDSDDHDVETSAMSKAATVKGPTLPPNFKKPITSNHPVFLNQDDDEAEDDESNDKSVTGRLKVTGPIKGMAFGTGQATRESKACIQKALEEDPQAFAYDELYEDIQSKRAEAKEAGQKVRGASKYVDSLLRSAQLRKIEEQRRIDRKIEKERQAEGEQFDDKETFVTEAYKQKLMERKIFEEQERQEKMMEEMMDVKKQRGVDGFYRHLLKQRTGEEQVGEGTSEALLKKISNDLNSVKMRKSEDEVAEKVTFKKKGEKQLRQRKHSDSSSEDETQVRKPTRVDRRKAPEIKSTEERKVLPKDENESIAAEEEQKKEDETSDDEESSDDDDDAVAEAMDDESKQPASDAKPETLKPKRELRDILLPMFEKRCVGQAFQEQQQKYFERLANRVDSNW